MFEIIFYEKNGKSEIYDFLENLRLKKAANKDARIQYSQAVSYIQLLSENGTKDLPKNVAEHLTDGIWELRPGNNRIFFFFYDDDGSYILLHQFRKKSQKTPPNEIKRAKLERADYIAQNKGQKT